MTEQAQPAEVVRVGDGQGVGSQPVEAVGGRVVGGVALPVPTMVEHHDPVIDGEGAGVIGEVFLGAAEPVDEEEAGCVVGAFGHGRETYAIVDGHHSRHSRHRARTLPAAWVNESPTTS